MIKNLLFIGDSITEGFNTDKLLSNYKTVNKGVSGDSTFDTIDRIKPEWFDPKPDLIFICIGTNDLPRNIYADEIVSNVRIIITKVKDYCPNSKIFLLPLFPTRDNAPRPNKLIGSINLKLKYLTDELNIGFFNIHPHFIDEEGSLKKEFSEDGLHLTQEAYEHWAELINSFLEIL